jgi:hypothetical protein
VEEKGRMRGEVRFEDVVGSRMAEEAERGREVNDLLACRVTAAAGDRNRRTRLDVRAERLLADADADAEATADVDARARTEEAML